MYTNMCTLMIAIDMQALTPAILAQGTVLLRNNIYRRTYLYTYVYIYRVSRECFAGRCTPEIYRRNSCRLRRSFADKAGLSHDLLCVRCLAITH